MDMSNEEVGANKFEMSQLVADAIVSNGGFRLLQNNGKEGKIEDWNPSKAKEQIRRHFKYEKKPQGVEEVKKSIGKYGTMFLTRDVEYGNISDKIIDDLPENLQQAPGTASLKNLCRFPKDQKTSCVKFEKLARKISQTSKDWPPQTLSFLKNFTFSSVATS